MSEERLERIEGLLTDLIGKVAIVHRDNIDIKEGQNSFKQMLPVERRCGELKRCVG